MFLVIKLINDNKRLKLHAATCLKVAVLNYYKLLFMKSMIIASLTVMI